MTHCTIDIELKKQETFRSEVVLIIMYMSHVMRESVFAFIVRCLESIIFLVYPGRKPRRQVFS